LNGTQIHFICVHLWFENHFQTTDFTGLTDFPEKTVRKILFRGFREIRVPRSPRQAILSSERGVQKDCRVF